MRYARGFTLLEMVVYIALLTLILGGTLAAAYQLLAGESRVGNHEAIEEEGGFVMRKIVWMMNEATTSASIVAPVAGASGNTLSVERADGTLVQMCYPDPSAVRMGTTSCSVSSEVITTENVEVTELYFYHIPASGGAPEGVAASTTIDGVVFSVTRYLRQ
jgi:hypothetical protein